MKNKNALIIIAKRPEAGHVKTRLNGHLPPEKIVEVYSFLLELTIRKLRSIDGVDTFIAYAPDNTGEYFAQFGLNLIPLHEGDLGTRMHEAFEEVFSRGYQKAVLVGADIPGLTSLIILSAMDILSDRDLVFGPAQDGGYYLVGMRKLIKEVFENVPWSSDRTLEKSLTQLKKYDFSTGFTDTLSDIDTIDDVKRSGLFQTLFI